VEEISRRERSKEKERERGRWVAGRWADAREKAMLAPLLAPLWTVCLLGTLDGDFAIAGTKTRFRGSVGTPKQCFGGLSGNALN
jgi:hypothetical protein